MHITEGFTNYCEECLDVACDDPARLLCGLSDRTSSRAVPVTDAKLNWVRLETLSSEVANIKSNCT